MRKSGGGAAEALKFVAEVSQPASVNQGWQQNRAHGAWNQLSALEEVCDCLSNVWSWLTGVLCRVPTLHILIASIVKCVELILAAVV